MENLQRERYESLKAGLLAASSFSVVYAVATIVNTSILAPRWHVLDLLAVTPGVPLLLKIGSAGVNGLLFGVTYRYIVRGDRNPMLKDGAVLAFTLVRSLAFLEDLPKLSVEFLGIFGLESLLCFLCSRYILDLAFQRLWIKPFASGRG